MSSLEILANLSSADIDELNATLEARLVRHLFGKAKHLGSSSANRGKPGDAGDPLPRKPALSPICGDCEWLRADGDGPCATHRGACESCGRGPDDGVPLHDGGVSPTKLGPGGAEIVERWCNHCDPPTLPTGHAPANATGAPLDRVQLRALRELQAGRPAKEQPMAVFRRVFDLLQRGLVWRAADGGLWLSTAGIEALR